MDKTDLNTICGMIRECMNGLSFQGMSKDQAKQCIKDNLRWKYYRNRRLGTITRRFKTSFIGKYHNIGLPSEEQKMVDAIISDMVNVLNLNDTSLNELHCIVHYATAATSVVPGIMNECDVVMENLRKIEQSLDADNE